MENGSTLVEALWRRKFLVLAMAVLAAAAGYGLSLMQSTLYQADGKLLMNDPRTSGVFADELGLRLDPSRYVRNQAEVIESTQVAVRASEIMGGSPSPREMQDSVSASPATDLDVVTITGTQPTASGAINLVDAVVVAYEELVSAQVQDTADESIGTLEDAKTELQRRIEELDGSLADDEENAALTAERNAAVAQLVTIDTRIEQIAVNAALYGSGVQLYVPPDTPTSPIQPKPIRNAAIAGLLGLMAGGALAWWRAEQDQRAEDRNVPARVLDAPLLGAVPAFWEVGAEPPAPTVSAPSSAASEAYHFVVSSLGFALSQVDGKTVMITSSGPSDGKSVTALNLALAASADGRSPLLIDVDERARGLTRMSGYGIARGVTDATDNTRPGELVQKWPVEGQAIVEFVPAGKRLNGGSAGYFRSAQFQRTLPRLTEGYDFVIFDAPPVLVAAETTDIASNVDGVVLVVRRDTKVKDLEDARDRLAIAGTPIIGYVFNWAKSAAERYGYGHGYGDSETNR
jgi:Mrp family chromosome partitioning ATPase/uncharacterized protein involved in exopolysaccharide biosynthesis